MTKFKGHMVWRAYGGLGRSPQRGPWAEAAEPEAESFPASIDVQRKRHIFLF